MTNAPPPVWGVLLAAGGSRRLGRPKQTLALDHHTLLEHAVAQARMVLGYRLVCVLGAAADTMPPLPCHSVINPDWASGLAGSITTGLGAIPANEAVMMMLADQPRVGAAQLKRLLDVYAAAQDRPAAARYNNRLGVPAIFPPTMRRQLAALRGDEGARQLLDSGREVSAVEMPEAALDIDTPDDLRLLGET